LKQHVVSQAASVAVSSSELTPDLVQSRCKAVVARCFQQNLHCMVVWSWCVTCDVFVIGCHCLLLCWACLMPPAFNLDFYTEVHDLGYLVAAMGPGPFSERFRALSSQLCELIEDYGLVAFTPLAIQVR
jgi:hypothetical protein